MFFALIFILLLYSPSIQNLTGFVPFKTINETRSLHSWPIISLDTAIDRTLFPQLENCFNDHFGFRSFYIQLKNQIDYSFFHWSKQAVIGQDGWIEDISVILDQQTALDNYSDDQINRTVEKISLFSQKLKEKGITLLLLPIPLKSTAYPQFFENISRKSPTGFSRFINRLSQKTDVHLINFLTASSSESVPLFYRTDLHWNEIGAFRASREVTDLIARLSHTVLPKTPSPSLRYEKFTGATSQAMGLFFPISETAPFHDKPFSACGGQKFPATSGVPAPFPFAMTYRAHPDCSGPFLPDTLLIGNSFMLYFYDNGFTDHFKNLYTIHDLTHFQDTLQNLPKNLKYIVWQFFETEIAYQFQQDSWWKQLQN